MNRLLPGHYACRAGPFAETTGLELCVKYSCCLNIGYIKWMYII